MCKLTRKKNIHNFKNKNVDSKNRISDRYERFRCGKSHMIDAKNLLNTQRQKLKEL